jgi:hypothetical protein
MDEVDIRELIYDLDIVLNKLASWEIDSVRDELFKIIDALEDKMYKSLMNQLSHKVASK